jgi:ribosomal protein S20
MNTFIKKFKSNPTAELLAKCFSLVDEAAQDNIIHKNKAARVKARLSKLVPVESVAKETPVKA